jgi:hypothetical protein
MASSSRTHPRDDPWLTGPLGVFAALFAAIAFAQGYFGAGVALVVNAVIALGRAAVLIRTRRASGWWGADFAETAENLWLPLLTGVVLGATVGSIVHGAPGKQIAIGALAGVWVTLCMTFFFAYTDWRFGGRRRDVDGSDDSETSRPYWRA